MTVRILPPPVFPNPLPSARFAQNGDLPSPTAMRRVASAYNHTAVRHRKVLFAYSSDQSNTYAPSSSSEENIFFGFRTGENVESIAIIVGAAPASATSGSNAAFVQLSIDDGSKTSHDKMYYPRVAAGPYLPSDVAWLSSESTAGVAPNTIYLGSVKQEHFARIHSILVYEKAGAVASTSDAGVADPTAWETGKPIYDVHAQDLAETGTKLRGHNAVHLLSWSRRDVSTAPSVTSTTYVNMLQFATTTYSDSAPGFVMHTQYHDTQKGDVLCEFGVFATRTSGAGSLSVKFVQSGGTWFEVTGITTTAALHTVATTVVAQASTKTDIHVKVSSGTWRIDSVGLWEYET